MSGRPLLTLAAAALSLALPSAAAADTLFFVTNTNDSGAGSLRQAITDANLASGADDIEFQIPGSGIKVIEPLTPLPTIAGPLEIYGYTQTGATRNTARRGTNARLKVVLSGANLTTGFDPGLTISAPDSLVEGLVVNRFRGAQIQLQAGASSTWIRGAFLGVNAAGTSAAFNPAGTVGAGIDLASGGNLIGGTARSHRNLISGNGGNGVRIGPGSSTTVVRGNLIGTGRGGNGGIGNSRSGVEIVDSTGNTIGGRTRASRNVLSGNRLAGVELQNVGTTGNRVLGNYIGVGTNGRTAVPNDDYGVLLVGGAANVIGSTAIRGRNVISGNGGNGVFFGGTSNALRGNFIGLDSTGTRDVGNADEGVYAIGNDLLIGGPTAGHRNVISGNGADGVRLFSTGGPEGISVQGNYIGTNAAGTRARANDGDGVQPEQGSNLRIGGAVSAPGRAPGNVISGNRENGIRVPTAAAATDIDGNLVGTNARGTAAVANRRNGLAIFAGTNSTLTGVNGPNVLSGNRRAGVLITGTTNNAILYNSRIGTNRAGTEAVPNGVGVEVRGSGSHSIGDTGNGNVISGNHRAGLWIHGQTSAIVILANLVGLGADGRTAVPNRRGIVVAGEASPNYIGFTGEPGNTVAGNRRAGIVLESGPGGTRPDGTVIFRNRIGITAGDRPRPNGGHGILIDGAIGSRIGDTGSGNRIAHNRGAGVLVAAGTGNSVVGNSIYGNRGLGIDLAPAGTTPNDPDDPDGGANRRQNHPVIRSVSFAGGVTTIDGRLNSVPSSTFVLEFFKTRAATARAAEARTSLGSMLAVTNTDGDANFSFEAMGRVSGVWLRATATRTLTLDTSELGPAKRAP